jgi:hypothetical protein
MQMVANARLAQAVHHLANRKRIAAAPDHNDSVILLLFRERAPAKSLGNEVNSAHAALYMACRILGSAGRAVLKLGSIRLVWVFSSSGLREGLDIEDSFASWANRQTSGTLGGTSVAGLNRKRCQGKYCNRVPGYRCGTVEISLKDVNP